ncbi:MAG: hypothetical protein Kow0063_26560 [Anaerolineae bacterium]
MALCPAGVASAQSPTPLDALNIALWPEYDRPEVLVIYRGQVAEDVLLPAQVSFFLPARVESLNAVAYLDETQGKLLNIPDYELVENDGGRLLSFTTPAPQFQFEYYDDAILKRDGKGRELSFSFTATAQVGSVSFELQQPAGARDFSSEPAPSETASRQDGLTYALYALGPLSSGDTRALQANYMRDSDQLSADLASVNLPSPVEGAPVEVSGGGFQDYVGPVLIAVGILLLTGSLVYWFWSQRSVAVPEPAPRTASRRTRQPGRKGRPAAPRTVPPPEKEGKLALYCHRCGTRFREDAYFCHACGAERRDA